MTPIMGSKKHVSGSIYVFFPLFGYWARSLGGGGGGLPRKWCTTCLCGCSAQASQKSKFLTLIFLIPWSPKMTIQGM